MENWESLIAQRMETHKDFCCLAEQDPVKRNAMEVHKSADRKYRHSEKGREALRKKSKNYRAKHPEKVHEKEKRYRQNNFTKVLRRARKFRAEHKEEGRKYSSEYRKSHKEQCNAYKRRKRRERNDMALYNVLININPIGEPNEPEN